MAGSTSKGSIRLTKKQKLDQNGSLKATTSAEIEKPTKQAKKQKQQLDSQSGSESESKSEVSSAEQLSDLSEDELDGNDEVNLEAYSDNGDSGSESDDGNGKDDDIPTSRTNKPKKSKNDDGSESFSNAVSALLGSHLKAHDRSDPILVRQKKKLLKQKEDEKLELKARRLINTEKRQRHEKARVKNLLPSADSTNAREQLDYERKLKKTAQRGVIKLFNAVLSTQVKTGNEIKGEKFLGNKKETLATELSKEKFLDLVKAAK